MKLDRLGVDSEALALPPSNAMFRPRFPVTISQLLVALPSRLDFRKDVEGQRMIDRIGGNRSAGMDLFPRSPTDLTFTTFFTQSMIPPSVSVECKCCIRGKVLKPHHS